MPLIQPLTSDWNFTPTSTAFVSGLVACAGVAVALQMKHGQIAGVGLAAGVLVGVGLGVGVGVAVGVFVGVGVAVANSGGCVSVTVTVGRAGVVVGSGG